MKKMKSWMIAAFMMWCSVMAVSACQSNSKAEAPITREESDKAFIAEIEKSPEFYAAMNKYLAESIGSQYAPGEMCIPCATVVACDQWTTDSVVDSVVVLGDFWVFNFNVVGDTLKTVSGGDHPGKMCLKKNEKGEFEVISFEQVEDGSNNLQSAKRIFGEMYEAFHSINSDQETREQVRAIFIAKYVKDNKLPVKYYQDYGWPAREIPSLK